MRNFKSLSVEYVSYYCLFTTLFSNQYYSVLITLITLLYSLDALAVYRFFKPWLWHKSALYLMPSGKKYRRMYEEMHNFVENVSISYTESLLFLSLSANINAAIALYHVCKHIYIDTYVYSRLKK